MSEFEVPKRAIEQISATPPEPATAPDSTSEENFEVSDQVMQDLDQHLGDTSDARELVGDEQAEEDVETAQPPQPSQDDWVIRRNEFLSDPSRDMSFVSGATSGRFHNLSERKQKKVLAMSEKLIAAYADRGVSSLTVGLLECNQTINMLAKQRGGGGAWDEYGDEYWLVHLGVPLTDERLDSGRRESEQAYLRYKGRKRRVRNVMDTGIPQSPFMPRGTVPRIRDDEWLPAVYVPWII